MEKQDQKSILIYETREEKLISPKSGKPITRIARILNPFTNNVSQAVAANGGPRSFENFPESLQQWKSRVSFRGRKNPPRKWKEWVDQLAEKYSLLWYQLGICDAILSSMYEVFPNRELVLGLSEFWCEETNTFVFSWGEATVTLEDVMILGGLPVVGESAMSPLTDDLMELEMRLKEERLKLVHSKARKPRQTAWLNHFMGSGSEFEHLAFLTLWLSRFVFPSRSDTIGQHVFQIAIHLSRGTRIALAPAVLASIYRDMRLLRQLASITCSYKIAFSGPLELVQLWACERFPNLGPNCNALQPGEPRVARYHKLRWNLTHPQVKLSLKSPTNFLWRPYAVNLTNWRHLAYYNESEEKELDVHSGLDDDVQSYIVCLQVSELVGVDCKENYFPHRVAMQFGLDQDLPGDVSDVHFDTGNGKIFIPARSFEPGVSTRYFNWWKEMMMARHDKIENNFVHGGVMNAKASPLLTEEKNVEDCHASGASGSMKSLSEEISQQSGDGDELTISMVTSKSRKRKTCADFGDQLHLIEPTREIVVRDDEMKECATHAVESKGRNAKSLCAVL
ncbi:Aminotransferase-like, plant mobile domain [Dillenia turbinata]|uniref:Aminotransferase-like, plant mobile domain n=1 Tax=Dillenia turbinata TaxID=194707 RepID=A0AAN8ZU28_9MAGN